MSYLATTALTQFWQKNEPLLCLGTQCLEVEESELAGYGPLEIMPYPWAGRDARDKARAEIDALFELYLDRLVPRMEAIHGAGYSDHAWRVVMGSWLFQALNVIYDRYHVIEAATHRWNFTSILPEHMVAPVPDSAYHFYYHGITDQYNFWLYGEVMRFLGCHLETKKEKLEFRSDEPAISGMRAAARKLLGQSFGRAAGLLGDYCRVIGHDTYFGFGVDLELMLKSRFRYLPSIMPSRPEIEVSIDGRMRDSLTDGLPALSKFETFFNSMLPRIIPKSFLEGFDIMKRIGHAREIRPRRLIMSSGAWHYDEPFLHHAAAHHDAGGALAGVQHGGTYGVHAWVPHQSLEISKVDRFYSWGWEKPATLPKVKPFIASKMAGRGEIGASNKRDGILFISTGESRYPMSHQIVAGQLDTYFALQHDFFSALPDNLVSKVTYRDLGERFGRRHVERLSSAFETIMMDDWSASFTERMAGNRICVIDHLSTTWLEALAANVPVIIYGADAYDHVEDLPERLAVLQKGGIIFETAAEAAEALVKRYDDVESWWKCRTVQAARKEFCKSFLPDGASVASAWLKELL